MTDVIAIEEKETGKKMSSTKKALRDLRKELGRGGYGRVAKKLNCTAEWVGQVLRSDDLAFKNQNVVDAAIGVVREIKEEKGILANKIREAVK